jgi:hypothetical protein
LNLFGGIEAKYPHIADIQFDDLLTLFLHALSKLKHWPTYVITDVIEFFGL